MEYGAVESGAIAHQRPDGPFVFFWRHWFVEGVAANQVPGAFEIFLTSLYPRCFPLVRYRIGDLLSRNPNDSDFDQTFERVIGRCNDCVELADGTIVHSEAFAHAVKECASVLSFQVVQGRNGNINFNYVRAPQCSTEEPEIRRRLAAINPALQHAALNQVGGIPQTIAGKTRTIVREDVHGVRAGATPLDDR